MKTTTLTLALIGLTGLAFSAPGMASSFQDRAEVINSTPVYESVNEPRRDCWNEQVGYETTRRREYGGAIIGGLVGGLLGNQVGKGSGRSWGTAVGAATGAIVGDNIDNDGHQAVAGAPRYEQRCRQIDNWSRHLTGYNVSYRYQGQTYSAFLPYDPGQTVRVNVNVSLAEQ
ncbi:MAG: glycine zipper 2TM domain-containing protein [Pseudomonadota bacterium]|nr:glycine zipper 2TM domain-containing protein [Pseudomonadota bacterium]